MTVTGVWLGAAMGLSFADVEMGSSRDEAAAQCAHAHFGFGGSSDQPVCATNGASASERSDCVTCSRGLAILTASVGRSGCMTSTMVRALPQPGSPQSRSLTLTTVSSSALMTVRACTFSSSAASLRRLDVFLRKKKEAMRIRQPNAANPAAPQRMNVITLHTEDQSAFYPPWHVGAVESARIRLGQIVPALYGIGVLAIFVALHSGSTGANSMLTAPFHRRLLLSGIGLAGLLGLPIAGQAAKDDGADAPTAHPSTGDLLGHLIVGNGPEAVIVLHEWLGDHRNFVLAALRGYGLSHAMTGKYSLDEAASDALRLMDHYGYRTFSAVGHSMSGMVVQYLMHTSPQRLKKVVAISPVPASGFKTDEAGLAKLAAVVTPTPPAPTPPHTPPATP